MTKLHDHFQPIETPSATTACDHLLPGRHCLLEANHCDLAILNSADLIEAAMRDAINAYHATLIKLIVNAFQPQGVTAVALLAESHMSIHTWPELNYAAIDAFTCGSVDAPGMCRFLAKHMGAKNITTTVTHRGPAATQTNEISK